MAAKDRDIAVRPWDEGVRTQIGILKQIGELLHRSQVSPQELQQIMDQLKSMTTAPQPQPRLQVPTYQAPPPIANPSTVRLPQSNLPPFPPPIQREPYRAPSIPQPPSLPTPPQVAHTPVPSTPVLTQAPTPVPPLSAIASNVPVNVADILRNLGASGLLGKPLTPELSTIKLEEKVQSALNQYEEMIINLDVRLDSLDLNKYAYNNIQCLSADSS